ncbi:hypothetical protein AALF15_01230 [Corynebacteriaceae bacterium 7-707]
MRYDDRRGTGTLPDAAYRALAMNVMRGDTYRTYTRSHLRGQLVTDVIAPGTTWGELEDAAYVASEVAQYGTRRRR